MADDVETGGDRAMIVRELPHHTVEVTADLGGCRIYPSHHAATGIVIVAGDATEGIERGRQLAKLMYVVRCVLGRDADDHLTPERWPETVRRLHRGELIVEPVGGKGDPAPKRNGHHVEAADAKTGAEVEVVRRRSSTTDPRVFGAGDVERAEPPELLVPAGPVTVAPLPVAAGASKGEIRKAAVSAGYSGDACGECGSMMTRREGRCIVCKTCGKTTGCG